MFYQYREKKYYCGNYLEIDIYPILRKSLSRKRKARPTTATQAKLNQHNAEQKLIRLLNTNFTEDDIRFDLTYEPRYLPKSDEQAARELQNFLRRLKRHRKKLRLPDLKYVAVTEAGKKGGRYHHHLVINGGVEIKTLAKIWGKGYTTVKPLQFDNYGVAGIAKYLIKEPLSGKRWNASKNLKQPKTTTMDGRLSSKKVKELHKTSDDVKIFEKLYKDYTFVECKPFYNEINGGYYLCIHMYKT